MKSFFRKNQKSFKQLGFTLVELLVVVLIVTAIGAGAAMAVSNFYSKSATDVAERQLRAHLRKAQLYSMTSKKNSGWGVYYALQTATLFCLCPNTVNGNAGTSFSNRNPAYDEKISFPGTVKVTGLSEVRFARITGFPNAYPVSITVNGPSGGLQTLSVNKEGAVIGN